MLLTLIMTDLMNDQLFPLPYNKLANLGGHGRNVTTAAENFYIGQDNWFYDFFSNVLSQVRLLITAMSRETRQK